MTKEEFKEDLYSKVEELPSEYAIKYVISDLIDEIYDLKEEVRLLKEYNIDRERDQSNDWYGRQ